MLTNSDSLSDSLSDSGLIDKRPVPEHPQPTTLVVRFRHVKLGLLQLPTRTRGILHKCAVESKKFNSSDPLEVASLTLVLSAGQIRTHFSPEQRRIWHTQRFFGSVLGKNAVECQCSKHRQPIK